MLNRHKGGYARLVVALALSALAAGCSKTVTWSEEVHLSTGDTIWLDRADLYSKGSEPGNPLQPAWWLRQRSLAFDLHGHRYEFKQDTSEVFLVDLLPGVDGPLVVAWSRNCGKPGYVAYQWTSGRWVPQSVMSSSLLGRERNLLHYYSATGHIPSRVTIETRLAEDNTPMRGEFDKLLLQPRLARGCE